MAITVPFDQQPLSITRPRSDVAAHRLTLALLTAVVSLALVLRCWGLTWSLPWAFHSDEQWYADRAQAMVRLGESNPKFFLNPSLFIYLVAGELLITRALGPLAGPLAPDAAGSANLLARLDSALIGTASVLLVFAIGATLFNRRVGLLAALFLAVSFLHVRDSHYGVTDVPSTGLLLLSVYFCARLLRQPRLRWYLLAGLAGGLATSTKYNMGLFFVPLLAAHWLGGSSVILSAAKDLRDTPCTRRSFAALRMTEGKLRTTVGKLRTTVGKLRMTFASPCLALAALASLVGYLLGTPYTILDAGFFLSDFMDQYRLGNVRWLGQALDPVPLQYLAVLLQGFGALPLGLALVGMVAGWRRWRTETVLVAAFPAVYLAFMLPKAVFWVRLVLPLLPFCSLLAAIGLGELAGRLRPSRRAAGLTALLLLALAQPLANDVWHDRLLTQTDTRVLANDWVQANLPPGSHLRIHDWSLKDISAEPRLYTPNAADLQFDRFEGNTDVDQVRYLADHDVQYVVTSSYFYERYLIDPPLPRQKESGRRHQRQQRNLEQEANLIARFSPGVGGSEVPYRYDDMYTPFWSLEQFERTGPTIRVYSLARLGAAAVGSTVGP